MITGIAARLDAGNPESDAAWPALVSALGAQSGIVCFVGAGGKKSAMYQIAAQHPGRVGLTSSVHIHPYNRRVVRRIISLPDANIDERLHEARANRVIAFANPSAKLNRHGGLDGDQILDFHSRSGVDVLLVKADGARGRLIKAPALHEPVLPHRFQTLVPVVSARVIGMRLDTVVAHRPGLVAGITGAAEGATITPEHVARLLASTDGACRHAGRAGTVVALINMVDTPATHRLAAEAARMALQLTDRIHRVVIASMRNGAVVEIVEP